MCVQCENQVKRTSVAMGQGHPVWKEEVTFKSVQITSDLQVSTTTPLGHLPSCPASNLLASAILKIRFTHLM